MADKISLANIELVDLLTRWSEAKEKVAAARANHTAFQRSIDELHRHLDAKSDDRISNVFHILDFESTDLLMWIDARDAEFKTIDSIVDKKYAELSTTLQDGQELLCNIDGIRGRACPTSSLCGARDRDEVVT